MPAETRIDLPFGSVYAQIRAGSPMVVFSHGFGVRYDSQGMFTDIVRALPESWGYILFDYNHVDDHNVHLRPYSDQTVILQSMIDIAKQHSDSVHMVAHSMGCTTSSLLASSSLQKIIYLAPPLKSHGSAKAKWAAYDGAHYTDGVLVVQRRDGTTSHIPDAFFDQSSGLDAKNLIEKYARAHPLVVIQATEEEVLLHTELYDEFKSTGVSLVKLPGNHNFDSPHRAKLISTVVDILSS